MKFSSTEVDPGEMRDYMFPSGSTGHWSTPGIDCNEESLQPSVTY